SGRRPREGLAHGPRAPPPRGSHRGRRPAHLARDLGLGGRDRARGRGDRHRLGRDVRGLGGQGAPPTRAASRRPEDRRGGAQGRVRGLHLHERQDRDRGAGRFVMMTPREIVSELDAHIVGQQAAKRAVAIAIRNRWRRKQLAAELREEVTPKNIIMIGPTGVGKTEIARRLAALVKAPFLKVEASKYTEVGYVGRDVESMIRDLVDSAVNMVKLEMVRGVQTPAQAAAEDRLLDLLLPGTDTETHEN